MRRATNRPAWRAIETIDEANRTEMQRWRFAGIYAEEGRASRLRCVLSMEGMARSDFDTIVPIIAHWLRASAPNRWVLSDETTHLPSAIRRTADAPEAAQERALLMIVLFGNLDDAYRWIGIYRTIDEGMELKAMYAWTGAGRGREGWAMTTLSNAYERDGSGYDIVACAGEHYDLPPFLTREERDSMPTDCETRGALPQAARRGVQWHR